MPYPAQLLPHFQWPNRRETEENLATTSVQPDPTPIASRQYITNVFTAARDLITSTMKTVTSPASANTDSTVTNRSSTVFDFVTESSSPLNKVEEFIDSETPSINNTNPRNPTSVITEILSEAFSTENTIFESQKTVNLDVSSSSKESLTSTSVSLLEIDSNPNTIDLVKDFITEKFSEENRPDGTSVAVTTTSPEASSIINTVKDIFTETFSEENKLFESGTVTTTSPPEASSIINTVKDIFTETFSKEHTLFESRTPEKSYEANTTNGTISTLRGIVMGAESTRLPLLDTIPTKNPSTQISYSDSSPSTFNDIFNRIMSTDISYSTSYSLKHGSKDATTEVTDESSTVIISQSIFSEAMSPEETTLATITDAVSEFVATDLHFIEDIKTTLALSSEFSTNTNATATIQMVTDIYNQSVTTETTLFETNASEQSFIDVSLTTLDNSFVTMKDMLSTEEMTDATLIDSTTEMMTEIFNDSASTEKTFESLKDLVSSTMSTHSTEYIFNETEAMSSSTIESIEEVFTSRTTEKILADTDNQRQMIIDSDLSVIIVVGVTLAFLIIFFVGIYVCCRKCSERRQHVKNTYYTTRLKDYSNSSVKTTSDSGTVNFKV